MVPYTLLRSSKAEPNEIHQQAAICSKLLSETQNLEPEPEPQTPPTYRWFLGNKGTLYIWILFPYLGFRDCIGILFLYLEGQWDLVSRLITL